MVLEKKISDVYEGPLVRAHLELIEFTLNNKYPTLLKQEVNRIINVDTTGIIQDLITEIKTESMGISLCTAELYISLGFDTQKIWNKMVQHEFSSDEEIKLFKLNLFRISEFEPTSPFDPKLHLPQFKPDKGRIIAKEVIAKIRRLSE